MEKALKLKNRLKWDLVTNDPILLQLIKYAIAGMISTSINLGFFFLATEFLKVWYIIASAFGFFIGLSSSFVLDKFWAFHNWSEQNVVKQYFKFSIVSIIAFSLNLLLLYTLTEYLGIRSIVAQLYSTIIAAITSFAGHRNWAFRS